jgi:hypothetical protein
MRLSRSPDDGCNAHLVTKHNIKPEQIRKIRLRAGSNILNPLRYKIATTELEAKFLSAVHASGRRAAAQGGVNEFSDEFVRSAPVQAMMRKVETVFDQDIENQGFVAC